MVVVNGPAGATSSGRSPGRCVGSSAEGYYHCIRGDLTQDESSLEEALSCYERARSLAETTGDPGLNVLVRLGVCRCRQAAGDFAAARDWANDALSTATRLGYRHTEIMALIERGRVAGEIGAFSAAESDLLAATELARALGAVFDLAHAQLLLAAVLHRQHQAAAYQVWHEASRLILEHGYAFLLDQERKAVLPLVVASFNHSDRAVAGMTAALLERLRRVPAEPLRVVTLGRFEVWRGMRRIDPSALRRRRADELLALLLLNSSHTLTFDQIAEALWSDKEPDAARIAFHHATSALRHALEPDLPDKFPSRYLKIEEGRVSLVLPPASFVDFEAFEAHCRHGEWSAALKLYAGDLFLDYLYEDWAIMPRQQLSLRYQQALRAVAEEHLKSSRFREALDTCLRLLALEPWHEQAVLLGMRACLALHDRAGALRLYHNLEQALRTELGITPCEELQALYRSLAAE